VLTDVLPYLRCPSCHRPLGRGDASLRCPLRHTFNIARQGYVDLAAGPLPHGDAPAMVAAREAFLATGGYDFLGPALAAAGGSRGGLVVDVGGGTGYHLARVLEALPAAVGLVVDAAKPALRRAARAHPRIAAVRADAWGALPLADHAAAVLLDVFAPRHGAELHRVLAADGVLLVATPTPAHLAELHFALAGATGVRLLQIDPDKPDRVSSTLTPWFRPAGETIHTRRLALARTHARAVVEMGPSAPHTDPAALARAVAALPEPLPVTASIQITRWVRSTDRSLPSPGADRGRDR
jgi:23S rRNA (guanine745-N1)-methyltransferase